jgi:hypothetical protein
MPYFLSIIVLTMTHYIAGFIGYFVKENHQYIEKEVVVLEKEAEKVLENVAGNNIIVKNIESYTEELIEDTVTNIEISYGVNEDDITFEKK